MIPEFSQPFEDWPAPRHDAGGESLSCLADALAQLVRLYMERGDKTTARFFMGVQESVAAYLGSR